MAEQIDSGSHPLDSIVPKTDIADGLDIDTSEADVAIMDHQHLKVISNTPPQLSLLSSKYPAILISNRLNILWQNSVAVEKIWQNATIVHNGFELLSVFQMVFNAGFQGMVDNWRKWAGFFIRQGFELGSREQLNSIIEAQNERYREELYALLADRSNLDNHRPSNGRIQQVNSRGMVTTWRVMSVDFIEGRLLLFDPDHANPVDIENGASVHLPAEDDEPRQTAVYFIAAELQEADRLQMEMLAREFSQLLSSVLRKAAETIDQFGGVVVQSSASGISGCFMGDDTNQFTPMTLVQCALELRSKMAELGHQWKLRKGWQRHIELNLGLHYSYEYMGTVQPSTSGSLTIFGGGMNKACRIASMAENGEIWASKDLISAMPQGEMDRVQFGLHRSGRSTASIIKNGFSRIEDLVSGERHITGLQPALIVTQIFDAHS